MPEKCPAVRARVRTITLEFARSLGANASALGDDAVFVADRVPGPEKTIVHANVATVP